ASRGAGAAPELTRGAALAPGPACDANGTPCVDRVARTMLRCDHMARRILIGIAGGSGSGKTLVARTIVRELGSDRVVVIDQDSYYRNLEDVPHNDRDARNFDHPDAFDNELLKAHVRDLLAGRSIEEPIYDYNEHRRL